ncbi:MAG: CapA family protein [Armatimonadetes bacterium]|nr:CapA family protein [Armatimonadota bacterium]
MTGGKRQVPSRRSASFQLAAVPLVLLLLTGCTHRPPTTVTIALAGDVMLGRDVRRMCATKGNDYPFANVGRVFRHADIGFCNLESPLTDLAVRFPRVNALVGTAGMVDALGQADIGVVNLANNHAVDAERAGLADTCRRLEGHGLAICGAGQTLQQAETGTVVRRPGVRVGFIGYSNFPYLNFVPDPQSWSLLMLSEENLRRTVPPLARRSDVVVVSFHWGKEGEREPSEWERRMARLAIDLGATIVVGHHAHVRGPIERYKHGLIAYCLGNLVFDDKSYGGNEGMILTCRAGRDGVEEYAVTPTVVRKCQAQIETDP